MSFIFVPLLVPLATANRDSQDGPDLLPNTFRHRLSPPSISPCAEPRRAFVH